MNKTELRQSVVDQGWTVQQVSDWVLVSQVEGVRKYDVNVIDPDNKFFTAQVIVTDDGGAGETAVASGGLVEQAESFDEAVRDYVSTLEGGGIFAIAITQTYPQDEVALATVYNDDGSQANFVVKRRTDTFSFVQLV